MIISRSIHVAANGIKILDQNCKLPLAMEYNIVRGLGDEGMDILGRILFCLPYHLRVGSLHFSYVCEVYSFFNLLQPHWASQYPYMLQACSDLRVHVCAVSSDGIFFPQILTWFTSSPSSNLYSNETFSIRSLLEILSKITTHPFPQTFPISLTFFSLEFIKSHEDSLSVVSLSACPTRMSLHDGSIWACTHIPHNSTVCHMGSSQDVMAELVNWMFYRGRGKVQHCWGRRQKDDALVRVPLREEPRIRTWLQLSFFGSWSQEAEVRKESQAGKEENH